MKMPKLVGKTLNHAHFALPNSTRFVVVDHKAKDPGVIWPINWTVCSQNPAPGAKTTGTVTLTVIKREETCSVSH
jgi:hypothetical protein